LKEQILLLVELQKNDSEMKSIKIKSEKLPEKIRKLDEELQEFRVKTEEGKKKLEELNRTHREKEEIFKRGFESLDKTKSRLLEVKTNKEYHAMLKEIEIIKEKNSEVEDKIIYILEEIDDVRERTKSMEEELNAYRLKYERERSEIEEEINSIDSELFDCQKKIDDVREKINADILEKYEIIKKRRNDLAVVSVWNGVCSGCYMNIPPQMYNELQKSKDLMLCPNCNRIMYWSEIDKK
jgi:hypothetical protein